LVHQLAARLLSQALTLVNRGVTKEDGKRKLLGHSVSIGALRAAAEEEYRHAGRFAQSAEEKIQWIDLANRVRPRTLF
jgi:hypothetical protein